MKRFRVGSVAAALLGGLAATAPLVRAVPQEACTRATADRSTTPTAECTRCHASGASGSSGSFRMPGHELDHPVDVDYDGVLARRSGEFVPRQELPSFVTLADSRITCLTCHGRTGRGTEEVRHLGRELCLGCHTLGGAYAR